MFNLPFLAIPIKGIPGLPDLTQPQQLSELGIYILPGLLVVLILVIGLGIAIALINFSLRQEQTESIVAIGDWVILYSQLLKFLQHSALILSLIIIGFLVCSTLANRYHFWEQSTVLKLTAPVAGERLEQVSPEVRYIIKEPYSYTTQLNGKIVKVQDKRDVSRQLALSGANIQVKLEQTNSNASYLTDFIGDYQITNPIPGVNTFVLDIKPPSGYSVLQNFIVEQQNQRLYSLNPKDYSFPIRLDPGKTTTFRVKYRAQGSPRWVYNAKSQLLSNFRLTVAANFSGIEFASGISPTRTESRNNGKIFVWAFDDNVSVNNPFGVYTPANSSKNTGILPRLLILAPLICGWWLLLLYFSIPLTLRNVTIAILVYFGSIFTITYISRLLKTDLAGLRISTDLAWIGLSILLIFLAWGLGSPNWRVSLAAVISTIAGVIIPVFGLLNPYTGIILSIGIFLSIIWLVIRNWYGWYELTPSPKPLPLIEIDELLGNENTENE